MANKESKWDRVKTGVKNMGNYIKSEAKATVQDFRDVGGAVKKDIKDVGGSIKKNVKSVGSKVKAAYKKDKPVRDKFVSKIMDSDVAGIAMGASGGLNMVTGKGASLIGRALKGSTSKINMAKRAKWNERAPINKERLAVEKTNKENISRDKIFKSKITKNTGIKKGLSTEMVENKSGVEKLRYKDRLNTKLAKRGHRVGYTKDK